MYYEVEHPIFNPWVCFPLEPNDRFSFMHSQDQKMTQLVISKGATLTHNASTPDSTGIRCKTNDNSRKWQWYRLQITPVGPSLHGVLLVATRPIVSVFTLLTSCSTPVATRPVVSVIPCRLPVQRHKTRPCSRQIHSLCFNSKSHQLSVLVLTHGELQFPEYMVIDVT